MGLGLFKGLHEYVHVMTRRRYHDSALGGGRRPAVSLSADVAAAIAASAAASLAERGDGGEGGAEKGRCRRRI